SFVVIIDCVYAFSRNFKYMYLSSIFFFLIGVFYVNYFFLFCLFFVCFFFLFFFCFFFFFFFFSSRRRHTRSKRDWSSDVCSSDLASRLTRLITDASDEDVLNPYRSQGIDVTST